MNLKIDESVKNPGKYGPYQQTHKLERYKQLAYQLLKEGKAYRCFCTKQELDEARAKSLQTGHTPKYNRHCLYLTNEEIQEKLNKKIPFTIRLIIPDGQNIS
jgi:glutamyl-tRNA synthetase